MNRIKEMLNKYSKEDIEMAQSYDYESRYNYLYDRIRLILDKDQGLLQNPIKTKEKAIIDILFCEIEILLDEAEDLIDLRK